MPPISPREQHKRSSRPAPRGWGPGRRSLSAHGVSAPRPSLRAGSSPPRAGPPQRRLPPPPSRRRRRAAGGRDGATGHRSPRWSGAELPERGVAAGCERPGSGDGEPRGAEGPAEIGAPSAVALRSPFPAPPTVGRLPAPRRGAGRGGERAPPAGGAGEEREAEGSGGRRRGGGGQRRGRDSRTLHLQVHLAHLGEPVAQIHGKLLDHCGHTEGGAGERGGGVSRSPPWGRGRRHVAAPSPRLPSAGRARPPGVPVPHTLTLQIVLQIQHGGGRASAKGLLANAGSSLPIWRRRQQHRRLDSAKTTLAADGARLGRAAIGCPRP